MGADVDSPLASRPRNVRDSDLPYFFAAALVEALDAAPDAGFDLSEEDDALDTDPGDVSFWRSFSAAALYAALR